MVPGALSGSRVAPARAALGPLHRGMAGDLRRRESGGSRLCELWQQATRVRMNRLSKMGLATLTIYGNRKANCPRCQREFENQHDAWYHLFVYGCESSQSESSAGIGDRKSNS